MTHADRDGSERELNTYLAADKADYPRTWKGDGYARAEAAEAKVAELKVNVAQAADHLRIIAKDVRSAGDLPLVFMDENGAGRIDATLADELWIIAYNLAPEASETGGDA